MEEDRTKSPSSGLDFDEVSTTASRGGHVSDEITTDTPSTTEQRRLMDEARLLRKGRRFGRVELVEQLAEGQKISCWRAKRDGGRVVTVHALDADARPRERENFLRAAGRLSRLTVGRQIVGVVVVSEVLSDPAAYVSELEVSGSMADLPALDRTFAQKVAFLRRLCGTLGALHGAGIFHGCLRPANVLVDPSFNPVLSDVGAVVLDDSYEGSADSKNDYSPYAAREVRLGEPPDARSDVFSVGRLLYFVITGRSPEEPDEDSPRLEALRGAQPGLVRIVRRCTQRDPRARYGSLDELLEDLNRYGDAQAVGVGHPQGPETEKAAPEGEAAAKRAPAERRDRAAERKSERPPRKDETKAASPEPSRPVQRKAARVELRPLVSEEADEDPIAPRWAVALGAVGVALGLGAVAITYARATVTRPAAGAAVLAAIAIAATVPALGGRPWLSRVAAAGALVALLVALDPLADVANRGRRAALGRGSPRQRATALLKMKHRGLRDFSRIALRGVDFAGMDLAGVRLDGCDLGAAIFRNASLRGASLIDAQVGGADFTGADMTGVDASSAQGWPEARCGDATQMPDGWQCVEGRPAPKPRE